MDLFYKNETGTIYQGNVLEVLRGLPKESVQCVVTSPPYWGLRDYGIEPQVWDDPGGCEHDWGEDALPSTKLGASGNTQGEYGGGIVDPRKAGEYNQAKPTGTHFCLRCGAWRGSLGLEPTPELYVKHIVQVFAKVRRVLRKDGTLWLNLGDSYTSGNRTHRRDADSKNIPALQNFDRIKTPPGLKPKDMVMIPARVALALQADGWWLRSEIVWAKPNPMPESVTDRPTKSHEYIFLLTKSAKYFFNQEAVRENHKSESIARARRNSFPNEERARACIQGASSRDRGKGTIGIGEHGRNIRSVWTIATQPFPEAHFATFPEAIPERCIKAGTSDKGCCPKCGKPWVRVVGGGKRSIPNGSFVDHSQDATKGRNRNKLGGQKEWDAFVPPMTIGWRPGCSCSLDPVPCLVLDPFLGSGTVGLVAEKLNRKWIGIELNPKYCEMAKARILKKAWNVEEGQENWLQTTIF